MTDINFGEVQEYLNKVSDASNDERIQSITRWLILGLDGPLLPSAPDMDYGDIVTQLKADRGLTAQEIAVAFDLCEERVIRSLTHGEA